MNEKEAVASATRARAPFKVPVEFQVITARQEIIELVGAGTGTVEGLPRPGLVRDTVAWLITFGASASAVELAIEDKTGIVVRVQRSSGAAAAATEHEHG